MENFTRNLELFANTPNAVGVFFGVIGFFAVLLIFVQFLPYIVEKIVDNEFKRKNKK